MLFCTFAVLAAAALGGCAAEQGGAAQAPAGEPDQAEEELSEQSLRIIGAGGLHVKDSPALAAGADGDLACDARFVQGGRERITCTRGREKLEVILHQAEKKAVVLHRPTGGANDQRTFFVCTTSGNGPGDLPSSLKCTKKAPSVGGGAGGLASPFTSTVAGIGINNTHLVGAGGLLLRGMAPRSAGDYGDLVSAGVGAVLVFKNQTGHGSDVADEMTELEGRGLAASRVVNIPFAWKDIGPFKTPCEQTVAGLAFISTNVAAGKKTFFHCTVGEDRTGLLAAVHRLVDEPALTADKAWDEEMCERGYGGGNPLKPAFVKGQLDRGLTPLYQKMAWLVAKGMLRADRLDPSVCAADPETDPSFAASAVPLARLSCGTSTRFEP